MKVVKTMGSLYFGDIWSDEIPLFWRHVAKLDPSDLEARGQNKIPPSLEACGYSCKLILCDDGYELSSLPD